MKNVIIGKETTNGNDISNLNNEGRCSNTDINKCTSCPMNQCSDYWYIGLKR